MQQTCDEHGGDEEEQHRCHALSKHIFEFGWIAREQPRGKEKECREANGE